MQYREASQSDIPALAQIRAAEWQTKEFWIQRIKGYLACEHHPQQALLPRIIYIAINSDKVVGFIAGHLTRRFDCDGELQWINVIPENRRSGIASGLLRLLAAWFIEKNALYVCVNADADSQGLQFYKRHRATEMNKHWMVWKDISIVLKE